MSPAYTTELKTQEGDWNLLNWVKLKNVCCLDLQHVQRELHRTKESVKDRSSALR
jgi:hypothetical protein